MAEQDGTPKIEVAGANMSSSDLKKRAAELKVADEKKPSAPSVSDEVKGGMKEATAPLVEAIEKLVPVAQIDALADAAEAAVDLKETLAKKEPEGDKERKKEKEKKAPDNFVEVQKELKKLIIKNPGTEWEDRLVEKQEELISEAENLGVFGKIRERVRKTFEENDYLEAMEEVKRMAITDPMHTEIDGSVVNDKTKKDHHTMIKEYCEVAELVAQYSLKQASGQDDSRLLREIALRGWGTIPFTEQEALARNYLNGQKINESISGRGGIEDTLAAMFGGTKEGEKTEATDDLLEYLRGVEEKEDMDVYTAENDLRKVLNKGEYTREFSEAVGTWVGLLRLNKVMENGGGRYELIEQALLSQNKFMGFVTKSGIARYLKMDRESAECFVSLVKRLGYGEDRYDLSSVYNTTGEEMSATIQGLQDQGYDSVRTTAAYTALRILGCPQDVGHAQFMLRFIKNGDFDKEDLPVWLEQKGIKLDEYGIDLEIFREGYSDYVQDRKRHGKKCEWYNKGEGSLRDVLELGGWKKFLSALSVDNKRGALHKYWEDNKKRRGAMLEISGNRSKSSLYDYATRLKNIVTAATKMDQVDWLLDESPNANSETVKKLCDESKIEKDAPSIDTDPSAKANIQSDFSTIKRDIGNLTNLFKINPNSPLGKFLGLK